MPVGGPQGADFRVGAEPAAGQVHLGEVGRQQVPGLGQAPRVGHHQLDQRPKGPPAGRRVDVRGRIPAGARHHEPPEVTWLLPELDVGEEPELRPLELELLELLELDEPELVEPEPELVELEPDEPEFELDDPEFVELEPVEGEPVDVEVDVVLWCVDPGRTRASAPAVTTLAMVTAVVVDRTLSRPCSLAAMA